MNASDMLTDLLAFQKAVKLYALILDGVSDLTNLTPEQLDALFVLQAEIIAYVLDDAVQETIQNKIEGLYNLFKGNNKMDFVQ